MVGRSFVDPPRMVSVKQAAERVGVDEKTIKCALRSKDLHAIHRGMRYAIPLPALSFWQEVYWGQLATSEVPTPNSTVSDETREESPTASLC